MNSETIRIQCDCGTHEIEITNLIGFPELEPAIISIDFWGLSSYIAGDSFLSRLRLAWQILRHGRYYMEEMLLDADKTRELGEKLIIISNLRRSDKVD